MTRPLRTLPIVEAWDCHGCTQCCRNHTVFLNAQDVARLDSQRWDRDPAFNHQKIITRASALSRRTVLAQHADGRCVFLSEAGRCRIHEKFGEDAKPAVCRLFPLQFVPLDRHIHLTLRFTCPSAVNGQGESLQKKLSAISKSDLVERFCHPTENPPPITHRKPTTWRNFRHAAEVLRRMTTDERLPLVRRLVHGLRFCRLLEDCNHSRLDDPSFRELVQLLESNAPDGVGDLFKNRQIPSWSTRFLFRQAAVHFLRCHPEVTASASQGRRLRTLREAVQFGCNAGLPTAPASFQSTSLAQLEEPLGPLPPDVLAPYQRYMESQTTSLQYALERPNDSLVTSYRRLVFSFPLVFFLLRFACGSTPPSPATMTDLVITFARGEETYTVATIAQLLGSTSALEKLVAYYAR